ncbi:MAG: UDP-N-acetylglucosamine 1-carboxyvinyltransferase [Acutalibacteraceae bacterium]|nr:UDP-N-acetylglucosamine 1-carboxyvinyltransferase [Acutalibacteraceae bacterium]
MSEIIVNGGKKLYGGITVQGAKNSVLPVLAATVLCERECVIHNCPALSDVETSLKILRALGCDCKREGDTVTVDSKGINACEIPDDLMREMRSSVVFLGAVIGRCGRAVISSPGGCELGPRPIDLHLAALERMGVTVKEEHGYLICTAENGLYGAEISLGFPSVGATENIILAAATAKGVTTIHGAAKEPEISDLADFLNSAGARIYGCGSDCVRIYGVERLGGTEHMIIPDRIAAATYMACAAVTGGRITLCNIMPPHMVSTFWVFREAGCEVELSGKSLTLSAPERLKRVPTVRSLVYPGFPTDAGPIIVSMLTVADGTSVFVENIFENRFRYVDELKRFGAKIKTEGKIAVTEGVKELSAADSKATDLRGGAALVIAALAAHGESKIGDIHHIERGYDDIVSVLGALGADIKYSKD